VEEKFLWWKGGGRKAGGTVQGGVKQITVIGGEKARQGNYKTGMVKKILRVPKRKKGLA